MFKSPRAIEIAFTKLNNQINILAEKRDSIVTLKLESERQIRRLNEHIISLKKRHSKVTLKLESERQIRRLNEHIQSLNQMLENVDFQMPRLLEKHEHLKTDYLQSICK